mmetsp:Transcript_93322/g.200266  ORF Transcript_93322/g.200266 Transcript_93322/m.200266 type:complete len:178 (+) Transcript_93322:87-620(+)
MCPVVILPNQKFGDKTPDHGGSPRSQASTSVPSPWFMSHSDPFVPGEEYLNLAQSASDLGFEPGFAPALKFSSLDLCTAIPMEVEASPAFELGHTASVEVGIATAVKLSALDLFTDIPVEVEASRVACGVVEDSSLAKSPAPDSFRSIMDEDINKIRLRTIDALCLDTPCLARDCSL